MAGCEGRTPPLCHDFPKWSNSYTNIRPLACCLEIREPSSERVDCFERISTLDKLVEDFSVPRRLVNYLKVKCIELGRVAVNFDSAAKLT